MRLMLVFALIVVLAQGMALSGCDDVQQDIPACLLYFFDTDRSGAISYQEWVSGVDAITIGKDMHAMVNATAMFDACDYTGDYQLGMEDWTNRSWPCLLSNTRVLIICALCQQNGWTPGTTAARKNANK